MKEQPYTRDDLDADIVYLSHLIDVTYDRWTDGQPEERGRDFHMDSLLLIVRNMARDLIKKSDRTEARP